MGRSENAFNSLKYFIDPTLRPEVQKLNMYIKKGVLEKDEFLKYVYDNLERSLRSSGYVDSIVSHINADTNIIRKIVNGVVKNSDYDVYWDRNTSTGYSADTEAIKKRLEDSLTGIHHIRARAIRNTINELWSDARSYGIQINTKSKNLYEIIYLCLFLIESYDKRIENAIRSLISVRTELYSIISKQSIFESTDNWRRSMMYDKIVVWIDRYTYDYNKFDEERAVVHLQFAGKI